FAAHECLTEEDGGATEGLNSCWQRLHRTSTPVTPRRSRTAFSYALASSAIWAQSGGRRERRPSVPWPASELPSSDRTLVSSAWFSSDRLQCSGAASPCRLTRLKMDFYNERETRKE